ncbi:MAG: alpha-isopropylmalate synthase regulatory domain-containing protein [Firmicutes bacterium]|nr:alpha-isopropylmalate synthase regulatory domain-containing protein [Bacillota bacterium]
MRNIRITDMTMRQTGKSAGYSLSFREKIELVKLLDRLNVSVIEVSPITSPKIDRLLIKSISSAVKESTVAVSVGLKEENIDLAWAALEEAKHPRLQVLAPVSAVQMEYLAGKKPDAMLQAIQSLTGKCRALCEDVELIADDATRADPAFLYEAIRAGIRSGATVVTLCDAAGMMLPDQITEFLQETYRNVPELREVCLGISCRNELAMADACAVAAIRCGAGEVKCAAYGEDVIRLENVARILSARGGSFDAGCGIRTTQMNRILDQVRRMCQSGRSGTSPFDNGVRSEEGTFLTVHDDRTAVLKAVEKLGYDLSEEDGARVFEAFGRIAARKETVGPKELDAIVASAAMQVPPTYKLISYVINSGNLISATAHVKLQKAGTAKEGISLGDGPIDAAFLAIEQIAGHHYELDDFQIQAVTEGREAMGEAVVKLRSGGKLFSGRGISTDVVGASVHAYISALNKIVYEESAT